MVAMHLAEATPEEMGPLQQFKEAVMDLKQEDWILLRFLRARNYEVEKAEEMIRTAIAWREEQDLKNYRNWEFPEYYKSEMAYQYYGEDYDGAPILWVSVGKWNGKVLVDKGEGDNLLRWAFAMFERGVESCLEHDSQGNAVVDLAGLSYTQVTHVASLKLFYYGCQKVEQCYPEVIKSLTVINAPRVFTLGWGFIKGVVTRKTMEKIKIFGTNKREWLPELKKRFPKESILPELIGDVNGN